MKEKIVVSLPVVVFKPRGKLLEHVVWFKILALSYLVVIWALLRHPYLKIPMDIPRSYANLFRTSQKMVNSMGAEATTDLMQSTFEDYGFKLRRLDK